VLASVDDYLYAWRYYPDGRTETVFESGTQEDLLGVPWPEGMDALEHWRSALHPDDLREFDELLIGAQQRGESGAREYRVLDAGSLRWMHDRWRTHRLADGSTLAEGIVTDVTERHRAESELHTLLATLQDAYSELDLSRAHAERQSRTDALTGLANRRHFRDSLELTLARRDGVTRGPGVIMIDVDFFKQINDQYGHAAGDAVLVETARRIQHAARDNDLAARWGGEEFVLCAPDIVDEAALRRLADRLRRAIARQPMLAVGFEIAVTASVGAAFATTTGQSADELLDLADQAMYGAKRSGRNRTRLTGQKTATAAAEEPDTIRIARALALAASLREGAPAGHADHVAQLAGAVAQNLGLSADVVLRCRLAGLLHDVGKAAIPDRILFKPGPLTKAEWRTMRTHPAISERIVHRVPGLTGAARLVRHHHERWDGAGYPDRLAGEAIPIEARVIAAADAYSAMLTDRPYRRACSRQEAIAELERAAGSQLDPTVVDALVRTTRRKQWVKPPAADVSAAALRQAA
jgi:diguanylate cyclase (GGDEF)-like protein